MEGDPTRTLKVETTRIRPGQTLAGKYRIVRELGRGGMGVVYEAEDLRLKRTVALKFLPPGLTSDPEARERFVQEAQAASGLDHPNICTIHEIDEAEAGGMYIAMACYRGESLKEKMRRGPLEPAEAIGIALGVAEGLAKAHEQGIVHRDIKPGNIMITADGAAKILDFGLAKLGGDARLTLPGTTMGTAAYMSPEQARGDNVDCRTDVWSLGVVLYEMATGELPFGRDKEQAVFHAILHEPPRPAKDLPSGYPAELVSIMDRSLAKDPARRFPSAREMADSLLDLKTRMSARRYPAARQLTFRRSRKRLLLAAGALSLVFLAVAVWLLNRPSLAFESRDRLMVADADNLTGDKVFDLALRTAIEADLQQSAYAVIFDKPQISDTLRLMRIDPSARVDENLGYEVCRFAGVRAFILPRIMAVGEAYELEAILIDPLKRRHVDRIRVTARGREEVLLKGIDKLTKALRSRLGESLGSIEKADVSIATVTTSSWEALDYFSLAQAKRNEGKFPEAVKLYELALDKDPKFVAARSSLALVLIQFMGEKDKGKAMLTQALQDGVGQQLPERDLLPLKAIHRQFVDGDLEGALAEYRTIMELFPDLMPPYNNAGRILQALGRYDEAAVMYEEAVKQATKSAIPLQNMWFLHMNLRKDARAGESAARRLVDLAPALANPHSFIGYSLAVQEKYGEAEKEFRKTLEIEPDHPYALPNLGHVLFAAGRPAEAVPVYRRVLELVSRGKLTGTPEWDCVALVLALRESGQAQEARRTAAEGRDALTKKLQGKPPGSDDWLAYGALAAGGGDAERAVVCINKAMPSGIKDPNSLMDLAELYAVIGKPAEAIESVKKSLAAGFSEPFFPVILPEFQSIRKNPEFRVLFKLGG
jgi:serine/threonine protein kinase/tetratricopeptide (TPR) repeat protein